jgi:hypothetical protein
MHDKPDIKPARDGDGIIRVLHGNVPTEEADRIASIVLQCTRKYTPTGNRTVAIKRRIRNT